MICPGCKQEVKPMDSKFMQASDRPYINAWWHLRCWANNVMAGIISKKDTTSIPKGMYCYDENGTCPYWDLIEDKPEQLNGYCRYLEIGDWMERSGGLLWDQCKECGIKDDIEEIYDSK